MPVPVPVGGGTVEHVEVRRGEYHDSVTLMLAGRAVGGVGGVERVLVAMATELNVALLGELGYPALEDAGPADLVVAFACGSADAEAAALDALAGSLTPAGSSITAPGHARADRFSPRTTAAALGRTGATVTLISTPGLASVVEAMESLEYGASPIIFSDNVPIDCEVRLKDERADKRLLHWRQVAISACEQCGRSRVPVIHPPVLLADWIKQTEAELKLVLHPVAEPLVSHAKPATLAFLIGPEGGLTDTEVEQAKGNGFHAARLGPRVLRTETAPVVALAVAQQLWGDF